MPPPSSSLADLSFALADIVTATAQQVVEVQSHRSLASGFVWRDGFVVTADETLADEGSVRVELHDGSVLDAKLVGRDPRRPADCGGAAWSAGNPRSRHPYHV